MITNKNIVRAPFLVILAANLFCFSSSAITPSQGEFRFSRQWADDSFGAGKPAQQSSIKIIKEDVSDSVSRGKSWRGTPFQIGSKTYSHGLGFNSIKQLRITLNRPAKRFFSDIGLENNDDTHRGAEMNQGSVTFQVLVGDKELISSPVMRLKDEPRSIDVPLNGAREFDIRVGDGGDGRGWDQALWGGAEMEIEGGEKIRLQDLAWADALDPYPMRVSFMIGGKSSRDLLPQWSRDFRQSQLPGSGEMNEVIYRDAATGLELRIEAKVFSDFPAVEWVARIKNSGQKDSPLLENIQALDTLFSMHSSGKPVLHWAKGGVASFDDFAPQTAELAPGKKFSLKPSDGRSSSEFLPFFNLDCGANGIVLALGWSGRWVAEFEAMKQGGVRVNAGMASTRFILHPGEEIRTPSMLALFYEGDRWRGQNLLRQFILAHHRPKKNGQPLIAPITCGNWGSTPGSVHMDNIRKFIQHRLPVDYYWIDAGWYGTPQHTDVGSWATTVGNWNYKTNIYPQGFKPLSDLLKTDKRELMLWFEPERVFKNTPWYSEHRQWLLEAGDSSLLMNLGNSNACQFVTEFISDRITEFGLGCYRQDFNMDPVPFWRKADAPDRQGMSEIRHIEGLYAFWDGLLARHPQLIIDNCASGGRRIDLETIGRATPFWRTDGPRDPIAHQCHTYGLLAWVPFSATSQDREGDDYEFRSSMCSSLCINWNHSGDGPCGPLPDNFPFNWARRTLEQYLKIRDFYYGDYYPLTSYSQSADQWMAYQLNRAEAGQGLIVSLRRPESPYESCRFPLRDLEVSANYSVANLDTGEEEQKSGRELMEKGLRISIGKKPGSALFIYKKLPSYGIREILGWRVLINQALLSSNKEGTEEAINLLKQQLEEVVLKVPASAVREIRKTPLYFSPEYPGRKPTAEFHPDAGWLRANNRDAAMARAIEFSNIRQFKAEMNRMPNFVLHELAHAYHFSVLAEGYSNSDVKAAFQKAKISGKYDRVERWHGNNKPNTFERAYAINNPMEYFAEASEAFFSRNDYYPFTRNELELHDPEMYALLKVLWGVNSPSR